MAIPAATSLRDPSIIAAPVFTVTNRVSRKAEVSVLTIMAGVLPGAGTVQLGEDRRYRITAKLLKANQNSHTTLYQYDISIIQVDRDGKPVNKEGGGKGKQESTQQPSTTNSQGKKKRSGIPGLKKRRLIALALQEFQQPQYFDPEVPIATDYHQKLIAGAKLSFDDEATKHRVYIDEGIGSRCTIHVDYYDEFCSRADSQERYAVTVSGPVELPLEPFLRHLQAAPPATDATAEALQEPVLDALNVIFSYRPFQQCFRAGQDELPNMATTNGKKFFGVPNKPRPGTMTSTGATLADGSSGIGGGGQDSVPGFARSVRAVRSRANNLLLNVHSMTSLLYHLTLVQDLIELWIVKHGHPWTRTDLDELADFLTNLSVRSLPHGSFHRITKLPRHEINGRPVLPTVWNTVIRPQDRDNPGSSVADYFSLHHGASYPDDGKETYVVTVGEDAAAQTMPADRLMVMPGQRYTNPKELPFGATRRPNDNRDRVLQTGRGIFFGTHPDAKGAVQFELDLGRELLPVPFIQLDLPSVQYRNSVNPDVLVNLPRQHGPRDGRWDLLGQHSIRTSPDEQRWTYLEIQEHSGRTSDPSQCPRFRAGLENALTETGMSKFVFVPWPNYSLTLPDLNRFGKEDRFDKLCESVRQKFKEFEGKVDILLVILPNQKVDIYSAVKIVGDQVLGIPTVCSILKKGKFKPNGALNKDFPANLTMKMNLKTSTTAVNHQLAVRPPILTPKTMIIGIDVTHKPATALKDAPSIAAVVGSVDDQFAQWPVSLRLDPVQDVEESEAGPANDENPGNDKAETSNTSKPSATAKSDAPKSKPDETTKMDAPKSKLDKEQAREKVLDLEAMVFERLVDCWEHNQAMPDQIIIYRDGLSEGQFEMCRNEELPKIKRAIESLKCHRREEHVNKNRGDTTAELLQDDDNATIAVILICAVKRNHTRFFPADSTIKNDDVYCGVDNHGNYNFNPRPDTLIEQGVTYGDGQDSFLISQKGRNWHGQTDALGNLGQ
ncbi:hypothetical protein G647_09869 [Cladophialophora carrionii CBS 160.54]|uniref:Piwi domain-containing protein n=1 Tax=Cladophialophora carrionii CBS 160.54 TaxID=1279043 RepID=V9DKF3_9EURO|nr:uncharacterized protein G647_09869 [Cladophialophora carrionii CBS 160.54]ETI27186.1 hypothetical protein G647_09869 [Cladophialophora carrionii CBS 160.54]